METYTLILQCLRLFAQDQLIGGTYEARITQGLWLSPGHTRHIAAGADDTNHGFTHGLKEIRLTAPIAIDLPVQIDLLRTLVQLIGNLQIICITRLGPANTGKWHKLVCGAERVSSIRFARPMLQQLCAKAVCEGADCFHVYRR